MALTRADLINMDWVVLPVSLPGGYQGKALGAVICGADGNPVSFAASTPYHQPDSPATNDPVSVKGSAGTLNGIYCSNTNAAARYIHLYDKATVDIPGTDTPVATFVLPASTSVAYEPPGGIAFANGIAFSITTGESDTDSAAIGAADIKALTILYS